LRPNVVAFTGRKQSGKSTAAEALLLEGWTSEAFARPLKNMLRTLLYNGRVMPSHVERMLEGDARERPHPVLNGLTPRHAMQTLGTEWGRNCMGEDFWAELLVARIRDRQVADAYCGLPPTRFVITDLRFPNEARILREQVGAQIVRIERSDLVSTDAHASETAGADIEPDLTIINNCTDAADWRGKVHYILGRTNAD